MSTQVFRFFSLGGQSFGRALPTWLGATLCCTLAAAIEWKTNPVTAADQALLGATFGLVVPVAAWFAAARAFTPNVEASLHGLARHGADRRGLALRELGKQCLNLALLGAWLGGLTAALVNFRTEELWRDVGACVWIGALGGIAYGCLLSLGSRWGGRGRALVLVCDWLLGASTGYLGLLWPRAHLRNLLGAEPVAALAQWQSAGALGLLCGVVAVLVATRLPR